MKYEEIANTINLLTDKLKELGPAGEITLSDTVALIRMEGIIASVFLIFLILLFGFLFFKLLIELSREKEKDREINYDGIFFILFLSGAVFFISCILLLVTAPKAIYPLGYIVKGYLL